MTKWHPQSLSSRQTFIVHFCLNLKHLSIDRIRSARLSNLELHFLLTPYLFRSIPLASDQEYLDIINRISRDFTLSSNARVLWFDTTIMKLPGDLERLDDWPDFRGQGIDFPQLRFHQGYLHRMFQHETINEDLESIAAWSLQTRKLIIVILSKGLKLDSMSPGVRECLQQYSLPRKTIRRTQWVPLFQLCWNNCCQSRDQRQKCVN